MSKKVIIISASPRKGGNSDILCDEFVKGATEAGNEAEKIFIKDMKINYCSGCGYDGLLCCLENPVVKGSVYGVGAWEKGDIKGKNSMQEAYQMGKLI